MINTIIITKEKIAVILKAELISKLIFSLSTFGFSLLTNLIIPVSKPIFAKTSEMSIIELAIE